QHTRSMGDIVALALRSAVTFTIMALLWSLWNSDSIRDWLSLLAVVEVTLENIAVLSLSFLVIAGEFGLTIWIGTHAEKSAEPKLKQSAFFRSAVVTGGSILLLFLMGNPGVYSQLGSKSQELMRDLTVNRLSDRDAALLQQGYYEDLVGVNRFNSQLWEIYTKRPSDWPTLTETEAARQTGDNLIVELVPSTSIYFHGEKLSINRWGMRDRDYERTPPPNTYRIALTGPSFVMGYGV